MTINADQYRRLLDALELSQQGAAAVLHIDPRTSRRYALSESAVPEVLETLLRLMLKYKISPADVAAMKDSPQDLLFALMTKHRLRPQDIAALRNGKLL